MVIEGGAFSGSPPFFFYLPSPIFILLHQPLVQGFSIFRESEAVTLGDSFRIDLRRSDAALYHRHGGYQPAEPSVTDYNRWRPQVLLAPDAGQPQHLADVGPCIVLRGWCPTGDDVFHRKVLLPFLQPLVVGVQCFPGGPIAIGHRFELYKRLVGLLLARSLPAGGRAADVERVVVSDSSFHDVLMFDVFFFTTEYMEFHGVFLLGGCSCRGILTIP